MSTPNGNVAVLEEVVVTGLRTQKENSGVPVATSTTLSLDTHRANENTVRSRTRSAGTQLVAVLEQGTASLPQLQTTMLGDEYVSQVSDSTVYYYRLAPYTLSRNLRLDLAFNVYLPYIGGYSADQADPFLYDTGLTRTAFEAGSDLNLLLNLGVSHLSGRQVIHGTASSALDWSYADAGFAEEATDAASIGLNLGTLSSGDAVTLAVEGIFTMPKAEITSFSGVGDLFGNAGDGSTTVGATLPTGTVLDAGGSSTLCVVRIDMRF